MGLEFIVREGSLDEANMVHYRIQEFDEGYLEENFEKRCGSKTHFIAIAEDRGIMLGYAIGYDRESDGSFYLWMAGVVPTCRRNGILTALMKAYEEFARKNGFKKLELKTRNSKREMLHWLVKNGFNFTAANYREDIKDTEILAEKQL